MIRDLDSLFGYSTYNYTLYTLTVHDAMYFMVYCYPPWKCHRIREFQEEETRANLVRAGGCALLAFSRRCHARFALRGTIMLSTEHKVFIVSQGFWCRNMGPSPGVSKLNLGGGTGRRFFI